MLRSTRSALIGAAGAAGLLALTWILMLHVGALRHADFDILTGFANLHRPHVAQIASRIAALCDPGTYVYFAVAVIAIALARRRLIAALAIAIILLAANGSTELLKPVLAVLPSDALAGFLMAGFWTLLAVAGMFALAARGGARGIDAEPVVGRPPVRTVLRPSAAVLAGSLAAAAMLTAVRPDVLLDHPTFAGGPAVIGALALALATGVMLTVGRPVPQR
ncbi:MAG: hypothetical protein ACYC91_09850 [Solirubrobacteraceae bacterium]